jgi:hypothetical protein
MLAFALFVNHSAIVFVDLTSGFDFDSVGVDFPALGAQKLKSTQAECSSSFLHL